MQSEHRDLGNEPQHCNNNDDTLHGNNKTQTVNCSWIKRIHIFVSSERASERKQWKIHRKTYEKNYILHPLYLVGLFLFFSIELLRYLLVTYISKHILRELMCLVVVILSHFIEPNFKRETMEYKFHLWETLYDYFCFASCLHWERQWASLLVTRFIEL